MVKIRFSSITFSIVALVGIVLLGLTGFSLIEEYTFLDALYMTMITVSTVGFGEIRPLSTYGEVFTIILIILSFGVYAYAVTSITGFILDGGFRNYFINKRVQRAINTMYDHTIICGFGRNGSEAARVLREKGERFLIIENDDDIIETLRTEYHYLYVKGDASDEDTLNAANISNARALITTLPKDADNLLIVLSARGISKNIQIISRASFEWTDMKLKKAGADNVIMPDMVGGRRMAKLIATPDIVGFLKYMQQKHIGEAQLKEIDCCNFASQYFDKPIGDMKIRKISGVSLVGIKNSEGAYEFNPPPEMKFNADNKLFVMGTTEQIKKLEAAFFENP